MTLKITKPQPYKLSDNSRKVNALLSLTESEYNSLLIKQSLKYFNRNGFNKIKRLQDTFKTLVFESWWNNEVDKLNKDFIAFSTTKKSTLLALYKTKLSEIDSYPDGKVLAEMLKEMETLESKLVKFGT